MSKLTQGTEIFFIDPDSLAVTKITGVSSFNPGGAPADQIEDTDLEATTRTYKRGLRTPGQASMTVYADPSKAEHLRLHELAVETADRYVQFAIGWSDGTVDPTADSNGEFVLAVDSSSNYTRTWYLFEGFVSDFPFDFSTNTVVTSSLSVQRSGIGTWYGLGEASA